MARTAQTNVKLQNAGVPLGTSGFTTLNLQSPLVATDSGSGVSAVADSPAAGGLVSTQIVAGVASGNNVTLDLTTLAYTFINVEVVFENGQALTPTSDWSLTGSTVTVLNAAATSEYMVQYTHN